MEFKELLRQLDKLGLLVDQYAITSSGALAIRGIRLAKDIDLVVSDELWRTLSKKFPIQQHTTHDSIQIGDIEILKNFKGERPFSDAEQIRKADIIDGRRYVNLEMIKVFKKSLGREKDLKDLELIEKWEKEN